jgi:hypothetical protein
MAHDDVAAAAINQPSHGEQLPRPLKRWRLFVADKGRARLLMQSPRGRTESNAPARRLSSSEPDGHDSAA